MAETKEQIETKMFCSPPEEVKGLDDDIENSKQLTLICKKDPTLRFTRPKKLIVARMEMIKTAVEGDANEVAELPIDTIEPYAFKKIMEFFDIEVKIPDYAPPSAPMEAVTVRALYEKEKKPQFMPIVDFYDNFGKDIPNCTNKPFQQYLEACDYLCYRNGLYSGCAHYAECVKGNEEEVAAKMFEPDEPLIQIPSME